MPWKSDAQRRWGNSPSGVAAMGQAKVDEFNAASKGMDVPERVGPRPTQFGHANHAKHMHAGVAAAIKSSKTPAHLKPHLQKRMDAMGKPMMPKPMANSM